MLVVGDKEQEAQEVSVRHRKDGDLGAISVQAFIEKAKAEIESKEIK